MADTGEDRELKQRTNAHQAEIVRESKKLAQESKQYPRRKKVLSSKGGSQSKRRG